jgi:DNA-binding NarL/FixJ family response regulator
VTSTAIEVFSQDFITGKTDLARAIANRHALETQLHQACDLERACRAHVQDLEGTAARTGEVSFLHQRRPTHRGLGADLTAREVEVLELMAKGLLNKQVARFLGLQLNTVRNHSQSILAKLQAHSRLEAVATAQRDGIIDYPSRMVAI